MKSALRYVTLVSVIALCFALAGCAQRYAVEPDPAKRFEAAKAREAQSPLLALDDYLKIAREYGNGDAKTNEERAKYREIAGDALFRAVEFSYAALDPAKLQTPGLTDAARAEIEAANFQISTKAHMAAKELTDQHGDTQAAKRAREGKYGVEQKPLREALESRIDRQNAVLPSYKIIAALVNITGAIPHFSYWFALLLVATLVKLATLPLTLKMYKSQRAMAKLQPILKELQEKHKEDKVTLNQKVMETYKEHNVNPLATCFPLLIQLPFLWWVYNAIRLYEFHFTNGYFLWVSPGIGGSAPGILGANLGQFDMVLLVIYAISNYVTMRLTPPSDPQAAQTQKQMSIMMTFMMFYFFMMYKWSSAFTLYWLMTNIIGAWQQYTYIYKPNKNADAAATPAPAGASAKGGTASPSGTNNAPRKPLPKNKSNKRR